MFPEESYDLVSYSVQHSNPLYDFLTTYTPRRLKSMFVYCEYLYYNSPQIFSTLKKFAIYPVTDFRLNTAQPKQRELYLELLNKHLKLKNHLIAAAIDKYIYGNSFTSLYFPFQRFLECVHCGHEVNINDVDFKSHFRSRKLEIRHTCPACGQSTYSRVVDRHIRDAQLIKLIRWDPKHIEIEHNDITGSSIYYYMVPNAIKNKVLNGDKYLIATLPLEVIASVVEDKIFQFGPNRIFHLRTDAPAGISTRWGLPPIIAALKQFLYVAALRRANEAIALEHIVPMRILHPAQGTSASDPTISFSIANWINEMKFNIKAWRRDPLHLMFSPVPLGVSQLGGQGRALMVAGEIADAEANILVALGVPKEFVYGGFTAANTGGVLLRILENQLLNDTSALVDLAQWVIDNVARFLNWERISINLEPFKLVDDVQQKMTLLNANDANGGILVSKTALAAMFGRNLEEERKMRLQEALDEQRFQMELQQKLAEQQKQLEAAQAAGQPLQYDQQAIIASAQGLVQELMQLDEGTRRSRLHALQMEDFVMYSVVVQLLEQIQTDIAADARAQARAQGVM